MQIPWNLGGGRWRCRLEGFGWPSGDCENWIDSLWVKQRNCPNIGNGHTSLVRISLWQRTTNLAGVLRLINWLCPFIILSSPNSNRDSKDTSSITLRPKISAIYDIFVQDIWEILLPADGTRYMDHNRATVGSSVVVGLSRWKSPHGDSRTTAVLYGQIMINSAITLFVAISRSVAGNSPWP